MFDTSRPPRPRRLRRRVALLLVTLVVLPIGLGWVVASTLDLYLPGRPITLGGGADNRVTAGLVGVGSAVVALREGADQMTDVVDQMMVSASTGDVSWFAAHGFLR